MAFLGCSCSNNVSNGLRGKGKIKARTTLGLAVFAEVAAKGGVSAEASKEQACNVRVAGEGDIRSKLTLRTAFRARIDGVGDIDAKASSNSVLASRTKAIGAITVAADKFAGSFGTMSETFSPTQKLYPIADVNNRLLDSFMVDENLSTVDIYDSVDEGVYTGDYIKDSGQSIILADEDTWIQPSSIDTVGSFRYQCEVTAPVITPDQSFIVIRAAAPTSDYQTKKSPTFVLSNIVLKDPHDNLITQYKDIVIKGDNEYVTYISEPSLNNVTHSWDANYPVLGEADDYVLSFNIDSDCSDLPFDTKAFKNEGFQEGCMINDPPNIVTPPTPTLKISAIEITASGSLVGLRNDNYVSFYSEVDVAGDTISREIYPFTILDSGHNSTIWPESTGSVWQSSSTLDGLVGENTNPSGISVINSLIGKQQTGSISLVDPGDIADSGKLHLVFSHSKPRETTQYGLGAFAFSKKELGFDSASVYVSEGVDNWFTIREIELVLDAKKASGSRDYVLDLVGYSDDKILNVTPKVGGFLQNVEGTGVTPVESGFQPVDDLGIATLPVSDKSEFFVNDPYNAGGDHYKLATLPVVSGTEFETYTIPLAIYEDNVQLGKARDYAQSSLFEKLHVDLYPIPSGATLANIRLVVKYGPVNALMLHSLGHTTHTLSHGDAVLFPSGMKSVDDYINSNVATESLSLVSGVPHGYDSPSTIKTNYSRRWRGVDGEIVTSPYDPSAFDESFEFHPAYHPFHDFFVNFNTVSGNFAVGETFGNAAATSSGEFVGSDLSSSILNNLGLRFNSDEIYPGVQDRTHKTIDWTSSGDTLHGRIADAFENAVLTSGNNGYLKFNNVQAFDGFASYVRFSPDINSAFSSDEIILNKWDSGKNLEYMLLYSNNKLQVRARADDGSIVVVTDTVDYSDYVFPLSALITYNEDGNSTLKLYADNEVAGSGWSLKRAESSPFTLTSGDSSLILGHIAFSGVSFDPYIIEAGHSSVSNILESGTIDRALRQTSVENFFDSIRMKFWDAGQDYTDDRYALWKFVDDDINGWHIGAFNHCQFNTAFDQYTQAEGRDFVIHRFKTDGTTSYADITDIALPSSVPTDGIAYHSQIENDMLRFTLSATPDGDYERLYSPIPRVNKTLPRDYQFAERAFVVESVVEHKCDADILWPWDGYIGEQKYGPKILVSLYSRRKDPTSFEADNWGLISRKAHYIHPVNDCLIKLSTTFDYNDLTDTESEPWASFDQSRNTTELAHKYFSADINEMFVQYDIVYPSGTAFDSTIRLHTVHVGLEDALLETRDTSSNLNLATSGDYRMFSSVEMFNEGVASVSGWFNLTASGSPIPVESGIVNMFAGGLVPSGDSITLYTEAPEFITPAPLNLFIEPNLYETDASMNLVLGDAFAVASTGEVSLFMRAVPTLVSDFEAMNMAVRGITFSSAVAADEMNLFVSVPEAEPFSNSDIPLFINATTTPSLTAGSTNLVTYNVLALNPDIDEQIVIDWTGANYGEAITIIDQLNGVAFLPLDDEIRGVQTICWGDCVVGGTCVQEPIVTHGVEWYPSTCVDGGVARAFTTYSNPASSGFLTPEPYDKHFYGLRKYTGLVPFGTYNITITGRTASDDIVDVPRLITEWEYGTNDEVSYSGVKLAGDDPTDIISASGRNIGDEYGRAVEVVDDIMAVGSPMYTIPDETGYPLENAGTVFVYRREAAPSGATWTEHKGDWNLEAKLELPDGFKRDSYVDVVKTFPGIAQTGVQRLWSVGQEGRQLGHSLAAYKSDDREVIVAGAPDAKFSRTFPEIDTEPVNVALFVFTNEFTPSVPVGGAEITYLTYEDISELLVDKDTLFTYFSNPSRVFNVQMVIVEPLTSNESSGPDFPAPAPDFITKSRIDRHITYNQLDPAFAAQDDLILDQLKTLYHERFPLVPGATSSGIPPILGIYVDNTASLRERAVQPATDRFIEYWKSFAFASGLQDFNGVPSSGYVSYVADIDENWVQQSENIINNVLDTGNMLNANYFNLISSGVGPDYYRSDVASANTAAPSGGAVFVFENYDGEWTPIQRIDSPTTLNNIKPDRFGHSLDISHDGSRLIIGSPYINDAVKVYEINENATKQAYDNVASWLQVNSPSAYAQWQDYVDVSGLEAANKQSYLDLTPSGKYSYRTSEGISEYTEMFSYTYSQIPLQGSWKWLTKRTAPTSRLGYSVAVNEDGTVIAAGSPTDSLNQLEVAQLHYRPGVTQDPDAWFSNVNAGAVTVWRSRQYYEHNKAVEYTRFGNLFELLEKDTAPSGTFDHMEDIFNLSNIDFEKLPFSQTEIPNDAGLVFLIAPAEDALSDEILDNIEDWLQLGDRHLVLVANDPLFERGGAYANSTAIINQMLRELDSRMIVQPAKTKFESIVSGVPYAINAVPSYIPEKGISRIGTTHNLIGSGYGDIRLYAPDAPFNSYFCSEPGDRGDTDPTSTGNLGVYIPKYWELNEKCELPQENYGDLRAHWNDVCAGPAGNLVYYENNLPVVFGTTSPACANDPPPPYLVDGEPSPMIVAAETVPPRFVVYPEVPAYQDKKLGVVGYKVGKQFANTADSGVLFSWTEASGQQNLTVDMNYASTSSASKWYDPDFYNGKDGVLQAKANTSIETLNYPFERSPTAPVLVEENYNSTSTVVLFAQTSSESKDVLDGGYGDKNQNLYANLVAISNNGNSKIAQLGGWTGRQNIAEGYRFSDLKGVFIRNGNQFVDNVSMDELTLEQNGFNVAWIANTEEEIPVADLDKLKMWLSQGNKKLIITYGPSPSTTKQFFRDSSVVTANAASYLCEQLGLTMKPMFLKGNNRYASLSYNDQNGFEPLDTFANKPVWREEMQEIQLAPNTYISKGYPGDVDYSISEFNNVTVFANVTTGAYDAVTPIDPGNGTVLGWYDINVKDANFQNVGIPEFKTGIAKISIPAVAGSGYRVFIDLARESVQETGVLQIYATNGRADPVVPVTPLDSDSDYNLFAIDNSTNQRYFVETLRGKVDLPNGQLENYNFDLIGGTNGRVTTLTVDIQPASGQTSIDLFITGNNINYKAPSLGEPYDPIYTPRILSVSGASLDIVDGASAPIYGLVDYTVPAVPERIVEIPAETRPISHTSSQYCQQDEEDDPTCAEYFADAAGEDPIIPDGPVVMAQEVYFGRPFTAGLNRSRVTVISDPSLIQGGTILNEQGGIRPEVADLLRSLYPQSPNPIEQPRFTEKTRIISSERTSPHKLYANIGNSGLMMRFAGEGTGLANSGLPLSTFTDTDQTYSGNKFNVLEIPVGKPSDFIRYRDTEYLGDEKKDQEAQIAIFAGAQYAYGGTARFSGIYDGTMYTDANMDGGMPQIMVDHDADYLDFHKFPSGYPGDLFGYSISLFGDKLLVGAPFAAWKSESLTSWAEAASGTVALDGSLSGAVVGHNGGAGAAYLYEYTGENEPTPSPDVTTGWKLTRKFRPSGINTGQDLTDSATSQAYKFLGLNNYTDAELAQWSTMSDMFGHDVDMEYDLLVITAPGHDFLNGMDVSDAAFQRKSFNGEFDIQAVTYTDFGPSGVRDSLSSGNAILNNGALFSYQNNITDWANKTQSWQELQKVTPQGYNSSASGVSENARFGWSAALGRPLRSDGSYTLAVGSPHENYGTSGVAMADAGAAYSYDAMLRRQPPSVAASGSWASAVVYGNKPLNPDASTSLYFYNGTEADKRVTQKGYVEADKDGQIFIEVSGQDLIEKGYIVHRPYIEAVQGYLLQGEPIHESIRLFASGRGPEASGDLNLYVGSEGGTVYNNVGLYTGAVLGIPSGDVNLVAWNPSGLPVSSTVNMVASGAGLNIDELWLRVRGK